MRAKRRTLSGYVYAVEFEGGIVKLGQTARPKERFCHIRSGWGSPIRDRGRVTRIHVSPRCANHLSLETEILRRFRPYRIRGDHFRIPFEEAVRTINQLLFIKDPSAEKREDLLQTAREKVTIWLSPHLSRALKIEKAETDRTISEIVQETLIQGFPDLRMESILTVNG